MYKTYKRYIHIDFSLVHILTPFFFVLCKKRVISYTHIEDALKKTKKRKEKEEEKIKQDNLKNTVFFQRTRAVSDIKTFKNIKH